MDDFFVDWGNALLDIGINIPKGRDEFNIACPFHDDKHPSLSINISKGKWICHTGCGKGSLLYFLSKYLDISVEDVRKKFNNDIYNVSLCLPSYTHQDVHEDNFREIFLDYDTTKVPQWILDRGFSKSILKKWQCGVNSKKDLVIPVDWKNVRVGYIYRRPPYCFPKYINYPPEEFPKSRILFGHSHLSYNSSFCCIVEGPLDAMWLKQCGFDAVSLLGIHCSGIQKKLLSVLPYKEFVICLDQDQAGEKGRVGLRKALTSDFLVSRIVLPNWAKDVQDVRDMDLLRDIILNRTYFF